MLCTCSGERFQIEETPRSPESLATRDFSANGSSTRTVGLERNFDDDEQVDEAESDLRETISLNYEEARALLGRLEYQRGNFDQALQVLQGIDIKSLRTRMARAIALNFSPRKIHSTKGEKLLVNNTMSVHSVSLLLEAILLTSKSLEALGQAKEAALECKTIIDIVESAWPDGAPDGLGLEQDCKLMEMFHKALQSFPKLWMQAGCPNEATCAYRRALTKPWNLNTSTSAKLQKDLSTTLLYSGLTELTPASDIQEAILLFLILMRKISFNEIKFDPDIVNHLAYALSISGQFKILANHIEMLLPGTYQREERWYILALCYTSAGLHEDALNIIRNSTRVLERNNKTHLPSLLLGAKLCFENPIRASEGTNLASKAIECMKDQENYKHAIGVPTHFLGVCYGYSSRVSNSICDSEKVRLQNRSLELIKRAYTMEKYNPEILYSLGRENAMQRNPNSAVQNATKYLSMVAGCSVKGWKLLALSVSAQQKLKESEGILDIAIDETDETEKLEFLRLKALVQAERGQAKSAIDTYRVLLAMVQAQRDPRTWVTDIEKVKEVRKLEMESWLDLASIYTKLGSCRDSSTCLEKAESLDFFSAKYWHVRGAQLKTQSLHKEALVSFLVSLSIDPDYVPSMVSMASVLTMCGEGESLSLARSFVMNALNLDPTNHEAWFNLGVISEIEGSVLQAADCFQAASELEESSPVMNFV